MENKNLRDIWSLYTAAWAEGDEHKRSGMLSGCLKPDCVYSDPLVELQGPEALGRYIEELQRTVPGVTFSISAYSQHHDHCLATWNMADHAGRCLNTGTSVGTFDGNGRLAKMTSFFTLPEQPAT